MPVPENIWLFRMVHWQNVAYVMRNGLCCREHPLADPDYINIGHRKLIADRHEYAIPLEGAGKLGEYVPFYFGGHSPMLYLIMNGYMDVEKKPQEDIVFMVCNFKRIKEKNLEFVFTDRNAKIAIAKYYNQEADFDKINWEVVKSKDWEDKPDDFERKDLKQAEFLVRSHVPVECIEMLVVKTEDRKRYFEEIILSLGLNIPVHVDNKQRLYY